MLGSTKDTVFISWTAITSDTNAVFNVQHSTDGVHFVTIKTVPNSKKTSTPVNYSAYDENPINGRNYYRIQQLRANKDSLFSPIADITATVRQPVIRYVKPGATGDGSNWQKASGDLQAMINAADRNDQIWVAAGTYKPNRRPDAPTVITPQNRHNAFLLKNHVGIYGGFQGNETDTAQRNWEVNKTILSGDFNGDDGISGSAATRDLKLTNNNDNATNIVISVGDDGKTVLDGFTITGGNSDFVRTDEVPNAMIMVEDASLATWYYGAGMYNYASSPMLRNITFSRNESQNLGGGGMYNELSSPQIINCAFIENNAYGGGGNSCFGGGIYNFSSSPTIINTRFKNNMGWYVGGGISGVADYYNHPDFLPVLTVVNCIFEGNTAGHGFGVDPSIGGAIHGGSSTENITNSLFYNNQAAIGGAIVSGGSDYYGYKNYLTVTNCTFYGNKSKTNDRVPAPNGGGAISNGNDSLSFLTIKNSIIYGNSAVYGDSGVHTGSLSTFVYENSLIQGLTKDNSNGNIDGNTNPLFTDAASGDLTLQSSSPVINKGNNASYPGGLTALSTAIDLAGNPRLIGATIDMGAFENSNGLLPVTMFSFTAMAEKHAALLQWKTATEINSSHFNIERSSNGISFIKLGAVKGHGTTTTPQQYNYMDVAPVEGNNYYRIQEVDVNGQVQYSPTRLLVFGHEANKILAVYPNPVTNRLYIQLPATTGNHKELQLFDVNGHQVLRKQVAAGPAKVDIDVSKLTAGTYLLWYDNQSVKVVKQ